MDDTSGFHRRDQSFRRRDPGTNDHFSDGGKSPDLAASMKIVRSYASRVKHKPPSPEPTTSGASPPFPSTFRRLLQRPRPLEESGRGLRRARKKREPPQAPPLPTGGVTQRPCYFSAERAPLKPSGSNVLLPLPPLPPVTEVPARTSSEENRPAPRLASPPLSRASSSINEPVARRRRASEHFSRRAAPDLFSLGLPPMSQDELRPAASFNKRFQVMAGARHAAQLTEVFC